MVSLFFSYSHRDEEYRNELETHLAMLKREGSIAAWHDRRVDAGTELHNEISEHLEQANIILLLVSAYFLASDYCYEREMTRALERHKKGEAVVIPVIVHPCDWQSAPFRHLRATPTDGKPISKFPNLHDAYLAIVKDIRQAISKIGTARPKKDTPETDLPKLRGVVSGKRSSNLGIKRDFSDHDQDQFLDSSFEFIANFFESSFEELKGRNAGIDVRFKRIDARQFSAAVYRNGSKRASCRIWLPGRAEFGGGIAYSSSESGSGMNEILNVENNGYTLLLKPMMNWRGSDSERLTQEGAAEHLWSKFIEPLQ
jgi:hypothetical protein